MPRYTHYRSVGLAHHAVREDGVVLSKAQEWQRRYESPAVKVTHGGCEDGTDVSWTKLHDMHGNFIGMRLEAPGEETSHLVFGSFPIEGV